jgi:hypothetical protein
MEEKVESFGEKFVQGIANAIEDILTGASFTLGAVMILTFLGLI